MRFSFSVFLMSLILLLASCASEPQFHSHVTRFHTPELTWQGKSFVVQATKAQRESLEAQHYQKELVSALASLGMKPLSTPPADYAITYDFTIGAAKTTLVDNGMRGYGWDFGYRSRAFAGPHLGWGMNAPLYPLPIDRRTLESFTTYPHEFLLKITDLRRKNSPTRFEGTVTSEGTHKKLVNISQCLIHAMTSHFPGEDGESINFSQPSKTCMKD